VRGPGTDQGSAIVLSACREKSRGLFAPALQICEAVLGKNMYTYLYQHSTVCGKILIRVLSMDIQILSRVLEKL
jgi:hypothetical protein